MTNQIALTGNIGRIMDGATTENGHLCVELSIAENIYKNGEKKETYWWYIVAYDKLADRILRGEYKAGDSCTVFGRMIQNNYTDKQTLKPITKTKIIANSIIAYQKKRVTHE